MPVIDTHQHFWKYDPVRDSWIANEMSVIQKDFLPEDLLPVINTNAVDGCVVVQSDQSEGENEFQLSNAEKYDFIKGVVGWVNFEDENLEERLLFYNRNKKMKGFRHVLQGEPQRDFMLRPKFMQGIGLLKQYNFTYDILVFPDQLNYTTEFVASFPDQLFVVDHIAKPNIKEQKIQEWKKNIQAVAKHENVFCKVSGLFGEAPWKTWKDSDFTPYLDVIVEAFGTKRIMFGSDWPVCLVAASYENVIGLVRKYFSSFSNHEQDLFFGENAMKFYNLNN